MLRLPPSCRLPETRWAELWPLTEGEHWEVKYGIGSFGIDLAAIAKYP